MRDTAGAESPDARVPSSSAHCIKTSQNKTNQLERNTYSELTWALTASLLLLQQASFTNKGAGDVECGMRPVCSIEGDKDLLLDGAEGRFRAVKSMLRCRLERLQEDKGVRKGRYLKMRVNSSKASAKLMEREGMSNDRAPLRREVTIAVLKDNEMLHSPVILFQNSPSKIPTDEFHCGLLELRRHAHLHDAALAELRLEVLAASEALQLPVYHNTDSSAKRVGLLHAVSCENDSTRLHGLRNNAPHEASAGGVHASGGLVQINDFGVCEQRDGYTQLPFVAATEISGKFVGIVLEAHFLEHGINFALQSTS